MMKLERLAASLHPCTAVQLLHSADAAWLAWEGGRVRLGSPYHMARDDWTGCSALAQPCTELATEDQVQATEVSYLIGLSCFLDG